MGEIAFLGVASGFLVGWLLASIPKIDKGIKSWRHKRACPLCQLGCQLDKLTD